jgi:gliding motility-associated protein GldM
MAGGKETPRQKMIGMMYLVLTALLALNVSKSILDAFVAIEENIQQGNLTELARGNEKKDELKEVSTDKTNPQRAAKAKKLLEVVKEIDKMTADRIQEIDDLKVEILETCGEDMKTVGAEGSIVTNNSKTDPVKPYRMNLEFVNGKDKYDDPMRVMLGDATDIKNPTGKGKDLWDNIKKFRKELTERIASSHVIADTTGKSSYDTKFKFKAPEINTFKDQKDLSAQIKKSIDKNVHPDDKDELVEIYKELTFQEFSEVHHVPGVHWMGKTFDHSPSVAAIASLSSLQKNVLAARAKAVTLIRSRVSGGEYSFNKVVPLAYGPPVVNQNDEFEVTVMMAAFDTDKQPRVTIEGYENADIKIANGQGKIKLKAGGSTMPLKGVVSVQKKSGTWTDRDWNLDVVVMKPQGSIELPDMNVLYRGYQNKVMAVASGYPSSSLSAPGCSVSKQGEFYIVGPGRGKTTRLSVSGKTADGKSVNLRTVEFRVKNLPDPQLFWGGKKSGEKANKNSNLLQAKYGPGIPLKAEFKILSWSFQTPAANKPKTGMGGNIASVSGIVRATKPGNQVGFVCTVKGPDGKTRKIGGTWSI